ncbi:hypothetical protein FA13DRAFT_1814781 [Coprinellus micaceus]|uniref:Uncharacterized protein n=1 Tax=Coprinellus micaceus TaxID=71717 RepID=A0A4Y7T7N7_COPMI|nr:hypothetical protein FA13DRAFT_1814781 [Coprinellus micaceus]
MPGLAEANGPTFISSHSADVILSDIRPFKLKTEALRSINVFLDELLYTILASSKSLVTDRLRAGLLGLLPTSIGKEALLEAEVELRAYWERTVPSGKAPSMEDDTASFQLQWAFELLRHKCEAYSTLNEADEDPSAKGLINERFGRPGASPPKAALIAPAALYLTAILEAVCEHVLSNVGRVAARDSSRTTATVNDLFTALCEDASIYGYFRTMKVYDQIEHLSKSSPKPTRRSKSFTRNERTPYPANHPESSAVHPSGHVQNGSRTSFEKSRGLRMFTGKPSHEREDSRHSGHKKSASFSEQGRQPPYEHQDVDSFENAAMLQEFDDLMRSASTMKMSLTPDRLKTMEVYKQEKQTRRPAPLTAKQGPELLSPPPPPPAPLSARQVDSILEDDEEGSPRQLKDMRPRQGSVQSPPPPPPSSSLSVGRARSVSTSSAIHNVNRKPVRPSKAPSAFPASLHTSTSIPNMSQTRSFHGSDSPSNGPVRKRTKQRARESMDLDDIMNGSDDDEVEPPVPRMPPAQKRTPKVSSTTRDLMDFLATGPPEDFDPPSGNPAASTASLEKPKGNRLQRMISKLNIGTEKPKQSIESPLKSASHYRTVTGNGQIPTHPGAFSPLANRPIPPRPPKPPQPIEPLSPPSSPSQHSLAEGQNGKPSPIVGSHPIPQDPYRSPITSIQGHSPSPSPKLPSQMPKSIMKEVPAPRPIPYVNGNGVAKPNNPAKPSTPDIQPVSVQSHQSPRPHSLARKPVPKEDDVPPASTHTPIPRHVERAAVPAQPQTVSASGGLTGADLVDMQRLLASATTADECRLIFDMFMAGSKAGLGTTQHQPRASEAKAPYPTPSPSLIKTQQSTQGQTTAASAPDGALENTLVDFLLGGSGDSPVPVQPKAQQPSQQQQQQQQPATPPSPPKRRGLPRPPKAEPTPGPSFAPSAQHVTHEKEQEKSITTWKNPSDFPAHATLIPA